MTDYDVKVQVILHSGFDGKEFNDLMYETMKAQLMENVKSLFEKEDALSSYVSGELKFQFFGGHRVRLTYTFSCHDENPAEAEGFAHFCLESIREKLEGYGYRLGEMSFQTEENDMSLLRQMGVMV